MVTIVEKLFENADLHPDKLAVVFEEEEVSYGELKSAVIRLASWFKLQGIAVGDRIVVQAAYCKWYVAACYAAHLCGAIFVPIEKTMTSKTFHGVIERMGAKAAVSNFSSDQVISLDYRDVDAVLSDVEEQPCEFPAENLIATILMTSGTTGPQKSAMLTQKNLTATTVVRLLNTKESDVAITFVPLNHAGCTRLLDVTLYVGSTYIFLDGIIKLQQFYDFIEKYHVNSFNMPPSGLVSLELLSQDKLHEYADQIDYVYIQSSPIQVPQREFLRRMLPQTKLFYTYGSSEAGVLTMHRFDQDEKDICCVGKPSKGVEVKIFDDALQELGLREPGRVASRTEMSFKGYWGMPELTENSFHDGYFLSNDIGYLDNDGFLYILGRVDDVINIGGLKVQPSEIENAALEIDGIEECICFDVPNTLTTSAAKLLVRKKEGISLTTQNIRSALMSKLDTYKVPASIDFVSEIVKNTNGKPDRKYYRQLKNIKQ